MPKHQSIESSSSSALPLTKIQLLMLLVITGHVQQVQAENISDGLNLSTLQLLLLMPSDSLYNSHPSGRTSTQIDTQADARAKMTMSDILEKNTGLLALQSHRAVTSPRQHIGVARTVFDSKLKQRDTFGPMQVQQDPKKHVRPIMRQAQPREHRGPR